MLLLPLVHISNIEEDLFVLDVSINEVLNCLFIVWLHLSWNETRACNIFVPFLISAILLFPKRRHIFELFSVCKHSFTRFVLQLLLSLLLGFFLSFFFVHFRLQLFHLLFLPFSNSFCSCLFCFCFCKNFLFSLFIEYGLFFSTYWLWLRNLFSFCHSSCTWS